MQTKPTWSSLLDKGEVGYLSNIPGGVFRASIESDNFPQAGLVDKPFLFALPEELLIFFIQRSVVVDLSGSGAVRQEVVGLAVGEESREHRRPVRMDHLDVVVDAGIEYAIFVV